MTMFTYSLDPPFEDPKENQRAFFRLPRSILLPPYLEVNPYFVEFCDAIDEVFDSTVEAPTFALQNIRDVWATNKTTEEKISNGQMISFSDWGGVDHATNVQQTNHLGLNIATAEAIDDQGYRAISKFIGSYWFGKGKKAAIDFLNFCLGTNIVVIPLWTKDYVTFSPYPGDGADFIFDPSRHKSSDYYPEVVHSVVGGWDVAGYSSGVGSSLQQFVTPSVSPDPPAWFPTTHVELRVPQGTAVPSDVIARLFYEIANYNLVIHAINVETNTQPIITEGEDATNILAFGHIADHLDTAVTPYHPIAYHNKVGGRTGGVGSPMRHISDVEWIL
jgi:hypothetical protein